MNKPFLFHSSYSHTQRGFTLIETLVSIFILTLTIGALLTLTAGGYFTIRYAKNDIVATNLLQESLEYIRNSRDSAAQRGSTWDVWLQSYQGVSGCDTTNNQAYGCMINPYAATLRSRVIACPQNGCFNLTYYPNYGMYTYPVRNHFFNPSNGIASYQTSFVRTITMTVVQPAGDPDPQIIVTAQMDWKNGTVAKHLTQTMILTTWNLQ